MADATHFFPPDFLWGTATASHQVEGQNDNNDWWAWEQEDPDHVWGGLTSGRACDWWAGQAEGDIERMVALHTNALRLSIEWSRIEPDLATWDNDAIDRYRAILKTMRDAGIQPMVTLHHFTNPLWVAEQGGWTNPQTVDWFVRFVKKAVADLADLCDVWCTIHEPNVYASKGFLEGDWPPGLSDPGAYFEVVYNLLQAHAGAYSVIHELQPRAKVGLAKHLIVWHPRSGFPLDRMAANLLDRFFNRITLDALQTGWWRPPFGRKFEDEKLKGTLDWIGLNYYQRYDAYFSLSALSSLGLSYAARPGYEKGPGGWGEIYPDGLFMLMKRLHRQFHLPIYITENGRPDEHDEDRPRFILEHLRRVWQTTVFGWQVQGYYFWTLVDNFEWAEGYDPRFRFGLYGLNRETQERTLRRSGELYAEIARTNSISSGMARRYAPEIVATLFPGDAPT